MGLLSATAATVFPVMIRSAGDAALSLTALNASSGPTPLAYGLVWWPVGLVLAIAYVAVLFRLHRGRVGPADGGSYGGG
jgi:cytochrome d ubiquinol oxidase subunit II